MTFLTAKGFLFNLRIQLSATTLLTHSQPVVLLARVPHPLQTNCSRLAEWFRRSQRSTSLSATEPWHFWYFQMQLAVHVTTRMYLFFATAHLEICNRTNQSLHLFLVSSSCFHRKTVSITNFWITSGADANIFRMASKTSKYFTDDYFTFSFSLKFLESTTTVDCVCVICFGSLRSGPGTIVFSCYGARSRTPADCSLHFVSNFV